MQERVKIGLWIDARTAQKFRNLVQIKYQTYQKGLLSYEAEMAFRHWLALHTNAQTPLEAKPPNPVPRVAIVFAEVKAVLLREWYYELKPGQQIPLAHIRKAIADVRGSDDRTVRRWLREFERNGLMKPTTSATWEVL
jgi:hypothetical protein